MLENLYRTFFSINVLRVLFGIIVVAYLFSLHQRYIQQDEPWFGEQAYWLVMDGNVKLKSMPGIFNWSEDMLIYHKLFIWLGAGLIFLFGWNIYVLKVFILLSFLTSAYLMIRFIRQFYLEGSRIVPWLVLLLLFMTPELIHRSFMFRPEVVIMMFGFASFYGLYAFVSKNAWPGVYLSAILAGLAFLTHLNALVFPVSGFLFLLYFKRWKGLVIFSVVTGFVSSIYFWNLLDYETFGTYRFQLKNWPTHQSAFGSKVEGGVLRIIGNNMLRLLNEHKRYFWDQDVWGISGLFLLALISRFRFLVNHYRTLTIYTLILMGALGVLSSGHSPRYLVYLMPFMVLITALVLHSLMLNQKSILKGVFLLVFAAHVTFAAMAFIKISKRNREYVMTHNELLSSIDENKKVLGPWEIIYNGIQTHQIHSFKTYEYIEDQEKRKLSQSELLGLAYHRFGMDYIIVDKKRKESDTLGWFRDWIINENEYYFEVYRSDDYLVLKRN